MFLISHSIIPIVVLFPSIVSSSIIYGSDTQCTTETLEPCKKHPVFPESIICENINDLRIFIRVLRCGSRSNMQEVFLEKSSLDFLPLYTLDFCGFIFLNVKSVVLSKLLEGNVLVRLQQLHLDNVLFRNGSWTWEPLSILKRLQRFSVANMQVPHLNGSLVDNLSDNLRSFTLTSTNTDSISDNALEKFSDIEYVSIQNNGVSKLRRSMFPTPSKIKFFYFGKNKITSLPDDLFSEMPDLQSISLQGNLISEIHFNTFRGVFNQLSTLLLEGNPLKCQCKMLWLLKRELPAVLTGTCLSPKHTFGKSLKHLSIDDIQCFHQIHS